ncbi:hypothetical protein A2U01_0045413, partial [Trifolium medium]|nr:hypothetical protein [Trifolium medium]
APISRARSIPTMQASYSAWLFVAENENFSETSTVKPSSLSRMRPAPLPLLLEDPPVNAVHVVQGFVLPSVSSAKKSVKTWAFNAFCGSNDMSNSNNSTDHLVIRPARSGMKSTCFRGWSVLTMMECARKYLLSFLAAVIKARATFSIFWYLSSGPDSAFEMKYTGL